MREMTKLERAKAIIAEVRAEYPNPFTWDAICENPFGEDPSDDFGNKYCVGMAYNDFRIQKMSYEERRGLPAIRNITGISPWCRANDAGDFERAWQLLTEEIAQNL